MSLWWRKFSVLLCLLMVTTASEGTFHIRYGGGDHTKRISSSAVLSVDIDGQFSSGVESEELEVNLTLSSSDPSSLLLCNKTLHHCQQQQDISATVGPPVFIGLKRVENGGLIRDRNVTIISRITQVAPAEINVMADDYTVTIIDSRRLQIGFTDSDVVEFKNHSVTLYVGAHSSENARLKDTLHLNVTLIETLNNTVVGSQSVNLASGFTRSRPITFPNLANNRHYLANITVLGPQAEYVELNPGTVKVEYSLRSMLWDIMTQLTDLKKQVNQTQTQMVTIDKFSRVSEVLDNIEQSLHTDPKPTNPPTTSASQTASSSTTTKDSTATSVSVPVPQSTSPTGSTAEVTTTLSSTSPTSSSTPSTASVVPAGGSAIAASNIPPTTKSNITNTTKPTKPTTKPTAVAASTVGEGNDEESKDNFMWWIFVGFLGLISLLVAGYLLYNHRAKVKVYVGNMWTSGSKPSTPSARRSNKYSPLPTSIHDTLTHED